MNTVSQSLCESIAVQMQEVTWTQFHSLSVNTQISAAALIRERRLLNYFR